MFAVIVMFCVMFVSNRVCYVKGYKTGYNQGTEDTVDLLVKPTIGGAL